MAILKQTGKFDYFKSTADYTGVLQLKDSENKRHEYWVFDKLKKDVESAIEAGTLVPGTNDLEISFVESTCRSGKRKGEVFHKVVDVQQPKPEYEVLTGTLSNLSNVRALNKQDGYVYCCLKQKGSKVDYLYMNEELTKSAWFKKGEQVQVEAYYKGSQNEHNVYEVKSLFKIN